MAWSKSTRISVMLAIDIAFFLLELTVGFLVHSLALMADAFHMLNDIISLLVGLWAVSVARKATTDKYSYGWLRAEILGAFFNAVFLIALCVSIILEALTRFVEPPEITQPKLILIVGTMGLLSNLVGFLVLGGHGHDHGGGDGHSHGDHEHGEHDHNHAHSHDELHAAEEGLANGPVSIPDAADERGRVADLLPEAAVARYTAPATPNATRHIKFNSDECPPRSESRPDTLDRHGSRASGQSRGRERRRTSSIRHSRLTSIEDISIHPASFRQEIIAASRPHLDDDTGSEEDSTNENTVLDENEPAENTPLMAKDTNGHNENGHKYGTAKPSRSISARGRGRADSGVHKMHNHSRPKKSPKSGGGHGHSHGDMGMNAMILHVIGDALGNVGVIVTALIIWLTDWPGRYYADPAVSLFITIIILKSALPLTFATSKILLQATPDHIDVCEIREDIEALPGVISCHHVHIWQLSDTKIVASMHIQVAFPISEAGGEKYMELARAARRCLHAYGIHSATIQPEFCLDDEHDHEEDAAAMRMDGSGVASAGSWSSIARGKATGGCLLECVENCVGQGCCSSTASEGRPASSHSAHSHPDDLRRHQHDHDDHDHDHDHDHEDHHH